MRRPVQRLGPAFGWASLILIATSIPIPIALASVPPTGADKLVHAGMYGVLAWLVSRGVALRSARAVVVVLASVASFAAVDEWHQRFIPGRSADKLDWIADLVGAGAGVFAFQTARRRRESVS